MLRLSRFASLGGTWVSCSFLLHGFLPPQLMQTIPLNFLILRRYLLAELNLKQTDY